MLIYKTEKVITIQRLDLTEKIYDSDIANKYNMSRQILVIILRSDVFTFEIIS